MASPIDLNNSKNHSVMNINMQLRQQQPRNDFPHPSPTTKCHPTSLEQQHTTETRLPSALNGVLARVRCMKTKGVYVAKKHKTKRSYDSTFSSSSSSSTCQKETSQDNEKKKANASSLLPAEADIEENETTSFLVRGRMKKRRRYQRRNSKTPAMLDHSMQVVRTTMMLATTTEETSAAEDVLGVVVDAKAMTSTHENTSPSRQEGGNQHKMQPRTNTNTSATQSQIPPASNGNSKWKKELRVAQDLVKHLLIHQQQRRRIGTQKNKATNPTTTSNRR